jgi:DNA modification methylase
MGLTCRAYDRKCILIDQSPTYLQKIRERLGLDQSTSSGSSGTEGS